MRHLLGSALIVVTVATLAVAVPPNDECVGAIPITGFGTFAFDSSGATTSSIEVGSCGYSSDEVPFSNDVWFEWTPPASALGGSIIVSTCGMTTWDTKLSLYVLGCPEPGIDPLSCDDDGCLFQSHISWSPVQAYPYLIRIGTHPGLSGGPGYFRILPGELPEPGTTPFVNCPSSSSSSPQSAFDICNARDQFDAINSTRGQFLVADDFIPESDGVLRGGCWWGTYLRDGVECRRGLVDFFEITYYADDCGAPGEIIAGPFSQEDVTMEVVGPLEPQAAYPNMILEYQFSTFHDPVSVQAGRRYWMGITNSLYNNCSWYWGTASGHAGYAIRIDESDDTTTTIPTDLAFCFHIVETDGSSICEERAPLNDECADAIPLLDDAEVAFDTYGATDELYAQTAEGPSALPIATSECDFPLGDEQIHRDVWYLFESRCNARVQIATCGSDFDTKIAVYAGAACASPNYWIACNDDACGDELSRQSRVEFDTRAGGSHLVQIGGYAGAWGQGTLSVETSAPRQTDLRDFALFTRCLSASAELCCDHQDFNADGDIDADDYSAFHAAFVGP